MSILSPTAWTHVTLTYNSITLGVAVYINGLIECSGNIQPDLFPSWAPQYNNIVSYWKMSESSWSSIPYEVIDYIGQNSGQAFNGATTTNINSKVNTYGGTFNNVASQYISASANNLPTGNSPRSFSIWLLKNANDAGFVFVYGTLLQGNAYGLNINSLSAIQLFGWGSSNHDYTFSMSTNIWYHIVSTYDGSTRYLYVNGNFIGSDQPSPNINTICNSCTINLGRM
jgi:hypothetical protein